ncbi:protein SRC2 homolog [Eucalyptus grandis]|uniref:protein SRC2 homolog n=1 Tax=Eucalyptus grandis TaxID=71139 RepID=UPI00192E991C|nr:protein SRC2 homolog [Eucalyptus grandis]
MVFRTLEITMISFMGREAVSFYLVGSLSGNKSDKRQRTPVHKDGSMNRTFVFPVDGATARAGRLKFKIMAKRTFSFDKDVGEVDVPVRDLLEEGGAGDGKPKVLKYSVRSPSGKSKGVLGFSFKFREAAPPPGACPLNPVPTNGYPSLGNRYAVPPPASQAALKKAGGKIFMLMGKFLEKLLTGDCISNAINDVGFDYGGDK